MSGVDENKNINISDDLIGQDAAAIQIKLLQQIKKELKDQTAILQQILVK